MRQSQIPTYYKHCNTLQTHRFWKTPCLYCNAALLTRGGGYMIWSFWEDELQRSLCCFFLLLTQLPVYCFCSQLFGEEDADQEVSPDTADPEAECEWKHDASVASQYLNSYISLVPLCHHWVVPAPTNNRKISDCFWNMFQCVCDLYAGNPEETAARATASEKDGDIKRVSTKEWARSTGYDPVKLFNKVTEKSQVWESLGADFITYM